MALKKSELYSSLWAGCDELRGGMDASQYKDYVLVLLFVKYVSDKFAGQPYAPITIPPGASFADTPTSCTSSARSRAPARAHASFRMGFSSAAMPRASSAAI